MHWMLWKPRLAASSPACPGLGQPALRCSRKSTRPPRRRPMWQAGTATGGWCRPCCRDSVGTGDAEVDRVEKRLLVLARREDRQRVAGDGAVVPGALDRVLQGGVPLHQRDGPVEILLVLLARLQGAGPEVAFLRRPAPVAQNHRQRDLALAEIVADRLAEDRLLAGIVERVVDQLEREPQVAAERLQCRAFLAPAAGNHAADFGGGREQGGGLGLDHREIGVLG